MTSERGKRTAGSTTHVEALIAVAGAALVLSVGAYLTCIASRESGNSSLRSVPMGGGEARAGSSR